MKKDNFVLPDKWIVEVTPMQDVVLTDWSNKLNGSTLNPLPIDDSKKLIYNESGNYCYSSRIYPDIVNDREVITFEQFEKYVLGIKPNIETEDYSYLIPVLKSLNL